MRTPRWTSRQPHKPDPYLAVDTFKFLSSVDEWVLRRVEQVRFESDVAARRQVTLDFRMPVNRPRRRTDRHHLVPLGFLKKQALTDFDLRDEGGNSVPLATRRENGLAAWSVLVEHADLILRDESLTLRSSIVSDLWRLVICYAEEADHVVGQLWNRRNASRERLVLREDKQFSGLARHLANEFMLIVPMKHDPGNRRILKYSYVERFPWPTLSIAKRLAWLPVTLEFPVPALGESESYHFEVTAPPGLVIAKAELRAGAEILTKSTKTGGVAHLYFPHERERPKARPVAGVSVQPATPGVIRSSLIFMFLLTGLLLLFALRLREVKDDAALAVLLAVPGLIALFVVRPREHDLTTRLLLTIRLLVISAAFLPLGAASILAIDAAAATVRDMWYAMTAFAAVCLFLLLVATARLSHHPRG